MSRIKVYYNSACPVCNAGIEGQKRLNIGAQAFRALWARTPGQRLLARLVGTPLMGRLAERAYNAFAARLYAWNRRKGRW